MAQVQWPTGTRTESFGFLLQSLARRMDTIVKARLHDIGVEFRFFPSLMMLLAKDGQSQRELGGRFGLPEYQTSRNIDAMEQHGLVERRPCPESRRTTLVYLTKEGREVAESLPPHIVALNAEFLSPLTSDERVMAIELLQKLLVADAADHTP